MWPRQDAGAQLRRTLELYWITMFLSDPRVLRLPGRLIDDAELALRAEAAEAVFQRDLGWPADPFDLLAGIWPTKPATP